MFDNTGSVAWLVTNEARVLAFAEIAESRAARRKGLLGRTETEGVLILPSCRWVHTIGMKFPIDVAFVDEEGNVLKTVQMKPYRIGWPVWAARCAIEAEAGSFERWELAPGIVISIRDADVPSGLPTS